MKVLITLLLVALISLSAAQLYETDSLRKEFKKFDHDGFINWGRGTAPQAPDPQLAPSSDYDVNKLTR